jgi:hypothetical protein
MKLSKKNKVYLLFLFLIFFFLNSCVKDPHWNNSYILSQNKEYNTSSLIYKNPKSFLEVEFLQYDNKISCFLNIFSLETANNSKNIPIFFSTDSDKLQSYGYIREGNQKITLNEEAKDFLIEALNKNQTVTIKVDEMEESIIPENFSQKYKKLLDYNSFYNKLLKSFY